jgi:hypothetical protein
MWQVKIGIRQDIATASLDQTCASCARRLNGDGGKRRLYGERVYGSGRGF